MPTLRDFQKRAERKFGRDTDKLADEHQTGASQSQGELLRQLQSQVADINQSRRNIRRAADSLWPDTNRDNAPIRKSFKLPTNRPIQ